MLLTLLTWLTLLALILLRAMLARSTASTTPSAASPSGFTGGTVRSTIHIVVTLLLCVTWAVLIRARPWFLRPRILQPERGWVS
jgi:hypothetical protein